MKSKIILSLAFAFAAMGCTQSDRVIQDSSTPGNSAAVSGKASALFIKSDYAKGDVTSLCKDAIEKLRGQMDAIVAIPAGQRTFDNTMLALEDASADFNDVVQPLIFMAYVNTNADIRKEGSACEEQVGVFNVESVTRKDLYLVLKDQEPRNDVEKRLAQLTISSFEKNGLKLSDEKLAQVKALKEKLSTLEVKFAANLIDDQTLLTFTKDELKGLPESFINNLLLSDDGKLIVTTKDPDYMRVTQNAELASTREKMTLAYANRAGTENTKLLQQAIELRQQIAELMGYKNWADYKITDRTAADGTAVRGFLSNLRSKLSQANQADQKILLDFKKELDPTATVINQWDINYLSYQYQKKNFHLDQEVIKEYFPADVVMAGLFDVYSQMLGVTFVQLTDAKVWSPDVKLYEVRNKADGVLISYFYTDLIPRTGKYTHAAAFPLISGRIVNGTYNLPITSIVANFTAPVDGKPSLMTHEEVTTVFHEFGHVMHSILTRAPYASLSGTAVAQDFVEAPSQMLENWTWDADILQSLSGHYLDHSKKLPKDLLDQMVAVRDFNQGYFQTRQLMLGTFDMAIHSGNTGDVSQTYDQLYKDVIGISPIAGGHFAAGFGHMMGGYDAGYYGYLWSQVYAEDMFTKFQEKGLRNPEVGALYRKTILEKGNTVNALDLLKEFLGREPSSDAFYKKLHINQ